MWIIAAIAIPAIVSPSSSHLPGVPRSSSIRETSTSAGTAQPEKKTEGSKGTQPTTPAPATSPAPAPSTAPVLPEPVSIANQIGYTLQKGTEGSAMTVEQDGTRGWSIIDGETTIANKKVNPPGLATNLRIDRFTVGKDSAMVKVILTPSKRTPEFAKLLETVDTAVQPQLIDTKGTKYPAVGFIYRDDTMTRIRYTLGNPLKGLKEAPDISRNRPDRELTLIFTVNNGVDLKELKIGTVSLEDWTANPKHVEFTPKR